MHIPDLNLGPLRVRWDFVLVAAGVGVVSGLGRQDPAAGLAMTLAFACAVAFHELGHALAARLVTGRFAMILQLTGGGGALRDVPGRRAQALVLLAGPLFGLLPWALGTALLARGHEGWLAYFGALLRYLGVVWAVFQLLPFPPMDGGLVLRGALTRVLGSATLAWRLGWVLGLTCLLLIVAVDVRLLEPAVWLLGMTLILGRGEAGYVRHMDAYGAWERGEHREVLSRVRGLPDYLPKEDKEALSALGVAAALELGDAAAVEDHATRLPAAHPRAVAAAEWLLRQGRPLGAKLAEQALDALDAERPECKAVDNERWADLAFQLAVFEARAMKPSSALGLLERAVALGFDHLDRLEAEAAFRGMAKQPRWAALVDRLAG
ncbi:MAG: hypothetical protein KC933_29380 [Myxococcales bacterium]|nr:hypothetical protein [Myxococcales bacterium]MCB9649673.1 hypothetical protein [Deltaproteobacteria bacterium]